MPNDLFEAMMKLLVVVAAGGTVWAVLTAVRVWLRRMERGPQVPPDADVRETLQRLSGEVAELQERVDFTERMLARQKEADRLPQRP